MAAHAKLSASSAKRWLTCPGSVALSEGIPDTSSAAADEGSAAHALAEYCLLEGMEPFEFLGEENPDPEWRHIPVTENMVNAVTVYTDFIRAYPNEIQKNRIEVRLDLGPADDHFQGMFGTCDHLYWDFTNRTLHVDDYKHGAGVVVEPTTEQCKYYALAALHAGKILNAAEWVVVTIVQPRATHPKGPIRSHRYSVDDLLQWMRDELRPGVIATKDPDAPRVVSEEGCRFCPAKGKCPELRDAALEKAKLEFNFMDELEPRKPLPELAEDDIADILDNAKFIENWLTGVKEYAAESRKRGADVTAGRYKLVAGKNKRDWKDRAGAEKFLLEQGLSREDLYTESFATPAAAEKLISKAAKDDLAAFVSKEAGGPTLVPSSDKRAEWSDAEADFAPGETEGPDEDLSFLD